MPPGFGGPGGLRGYGATSRLRQSGSESRRPGWCETRWAVCPCRARRSTPTCSCRTFRRRFDSRHSASMLTAPCADSSCASWRAPSYWVARSFSLIHGTFGARDLLRCVLDKFQLLLFTITVFLSTGVLLDCPLISTECPQCSIDLHKGDSLVEFARWDASSLLKLVAVAYA